MSLGAVLLPAALAVGLRRSALELAVRRNRLRPAGGGMPPTVALMAGIDGLVTTLPPVLVSGFSRLVGGPGRDPPRGKGPRPG